MKLFNRSGVCHIAQNAMSHWHTWHIYCASFIPKTTISGMSLCHHTTNSVSMEVASDLAVLYYFCGVSDDLLEVHLVASQADAKRVELSEFR
mgnify:FL=1